MDTQVLIVGAGPTGLMLANQLNRFGIDFIVVDIKSGPTIQSRAMSISSRSMEVYQQLDLSDTILERSKEIQGITMVRNGKKYAHVNLTNIGEEFSDFARLTTTFEQNKNEQLLYRNLLNQGKDVMWHFSFLSYKESNGEVITQVKNIKDGSLRSINSKYIVGCDGASSVVRKYGDFSFEGDTYDNKFYVADVTLSWKYGFDNVVMVPEKGVFVAFFPLQDDRKVRIIGTLPKEFAEQDDIEFSTLEQKVREVSKVKFWIDGVNWFSVYKIHCRVVDTFRKGLVFLAGDAAHVHSPAGGQGMNTGLQDAHNLGWKMAYVLKGVAHQSLLDSYNEERLPYALSLVNNTDKGFEFISGHTWILRNLRSHIILPLFSIAMKYKRPSIGLFKKLSQLFYSYNKSSLSVNKTKYNLKFRAGDRLPFIRSGFYNNFKSSNFYLIYISNNKLTDEEAKPLKELFCSHVDLFEESLTEEWSKLGVTSSLFILVRPDHHILCIGNSISEKQIPKPFNSF